MESWVKRARHWYAGLFSVGLARFKIDPSDVPSITKSIVNHVQTSLARQAYNVDDLGAYQAAALSVRDNMIVGDSRVIPVLLSL